MTEAPGFRSGEIRPSMDVFSMDGVRIGSVVSVIAGPESPVGTNSNLSGTAEPREYDGESDGPVPTRNVGNFGPATQSPETSYATTAREGEPLGRGMMTIATLFGMFFRRQMSLDEVQTVSMERVVLRQKASAYQ